MPRITPGLTTAALALATLLAAHPRLAPAATPDTYIGANDGNWTTQTNWSFNQVPNNNTFDVLINTPVNVNLDAAQIVNNLSINSLASLTMLANLGIAGTLTNSGSLSLSGVVDPVLSGTLPSSLIVNSGTIFGAGTLAAPIANLGHIVGNPSDVLTVAAPIDNTAGDFRIIGSPQTGIFFNQLNLNSSITGGTVSLYATKTIINGGSFVGTNLSLSGLTTITLTAGSINVTAPILLQTANSGVFAPLAAPSILFNSTTPNSQSVGLITQSGTSFSGSLISIGANATLAADEIIGVSSLVIGSNAALFLRPHGGNTPATAYLPSGLGSNALVDISDNKLIVNGTAAKSILITQLAAQITTGRNGGNWLGKGITSSTVAADSSATGSHHLTVSLFDNADLGLGTFGGQPAGTQSLLVATALIADSNADNLVDAADFDAWFNHKLQTTPLASRGDYNGDGFVNGLDFSLWFNAAGPLAQPLLDSRGLDAGTLAAVGVVPEPASAAIVLTVAPWLLARRRRQGVCSGK
jgi:hypothetical protein